MLRTCKGNEQDMKRNTVGLSREDSKMECALQEAEARVCAWAPLLSINHSSHQGLVTAEDGNFILCQGPAQGCPQQREEANQQRAALSHWLHPIPHAAHTWIVRVPLKFSTVVLRYTFKALCRCHLFKVTTFLQPLKYNIVKRLLFASSASLHYSCTPDTFPPGSLY